MRILITLAMLAAASSASAATVATGTTQLGDAGGINLQGPGVATNANTYRTYTTLAGSNWVWGPGGENSTEVFEFEFDMTGYDLSTASLSGLVSVDNTVIVSLNGTEIFSLTDLVASNFRQNNAYSTTDSALFNQGGNTLTFTATDQGAFYGLLANVTVEAETAPAVPLPAGFPLMAAGLGALALARRARD